MSTLIGGWLSLLGAVLLLGSFIPSSFTGDGCREATEALQRRDLAAAEELLELCVATGPAQIEHYLALCGIYQTQNREEDLVRTAGKALKSFPEEPRFYQVVGNHAGRTAQYERAIEIFGEAHRRWPESLVFQEGLAGAHLMAGMGLMDQQRNQEAEGHLREAVRLSERDVEARLNLGRVLHMLNQSVEALEEFDRVIELDPQTPLVHFHRGLVLNALGEFDQAIASLAREIEATPNYPPSYLLRGEILMKKGDFAAALPDLMVAVEKMPDHPTAVYMRGRCLQRLDRNEEAETDLRKAVLLDPSNPEPMITLARLLWLTGREEEAAGLSERARAVIRAANPAENPSEPPTPPK